MSPDLIRRAKILAAQRDTSVSKLVAEFLEAATGHEDDYDAVWARERAVMQEGLLKVGPITWTRDEAHER
jgi:hypothetical protein